VARDALERILEARSAVHLEKPDDVVDVLPERGGRAVGEVADSPFDAAKFPVNEASAHEHDPPVVLRVKRAPA
jgi:hypothetical protein